MPVRPWPILSKKRLLSTPIFDLRLDRARNPRNGLEREFHVLEAPDYTSVVALTPAREIILVRQFRFGVGQLSLEIPGGMVEHGLTPEETAIKELKEETGYAPGRVSLLGRIRPNPAYLNNFHYSFLVEGAVPDGAAEPEDGEDIQVELHSLSEVPALVRRGEIEHGLVLNALCFFWGRSGLFQGPDFMPV